LNQPTSQYLRHQLDSDIIIHHVNTNLLMKKWSCLCLGSRVHVDADDKCNMGGGGRWTVDTALQRAYKTIDPIGFNTSMLHLFHSTVDYTLLGQTNNTPYGHVKKVYNVDTSYFQTVDVPCQILLFTHTLFWKIWNIINVSPSVLSTNDNGSALQLVDALFSSLRSNFKWYVSRNNGDITYICSGCKWPYCQYMR
jgi:hypothetical protein